MKPYLMLLLGMNRLMPTRGKEPSQSTGVPDSSVPAGRVAKPGEQLGKSKSFETSADVPAKYRDDPRFNDLATRLRT